VLDVLFLPLATVLIFDSESVLTEWYFFILIITNVDVSYDSRNPYRLRIKMLKDF